MYNIVLVSVKYYTMPKNTKYSNKDASIISEAREAAIAYVTTPQASILKVASRQAESHLSPFEKMRLVRDGITKQDLESLKLKAGLDYFTLAKALSVTRATLINRKKNEKFSPSVSERILDIADLYSFGFEVFEEEDNFRHWMDTPNRALAYQKPTDLLDNQFGREEVRNVIGRIAYGVYS